MEQIVISIVTILLSGVLASVITLFITHSWEQRQLRRQLAYDIFGSKQALIEGESDDESRRLFSQAMNRVPVVFSAYPKVLSEYDHLHDTLQISNPRERSNKANEALITFMKELCKAARIDVSDWNDGRITRAFSVKQ